MAASSAVTDYAPASNPAPTMGDIARGKYYVHDMLTDVTRVLREHGTPKGYVEKSRAFPSVKQTMESYGWHFAGAGYFSAVFVKRGLAIKIGMKGNDSGLTYAAWCRSNSGLAGIPAVHLIRSNEHCYIVLMDRLERYNEFSCSPCISVEISCAQDIIMRGNNHDAVPSGQMPLVDAARAIRAFFEGSATFDLHDSNVMLDRRGNPVISDPVSFTGTRSNAGLRDEVVAPYEGWQPPVRYEPRHPARNRENVSRDHMLDALRMMQEPLMRDMMHFLPVTPKPLREKFDWLPQALEPGPLVAPRADKPPRFHDHLIQHRRIRAFDPSLAA